MLRLATKVCTMDLSIVIPVYNEEESVVALCQTLDAALKPLSQHYEVLLVDDGSTDQTPVLLRELVQTYSYLRVIRFRRNFGQTAAMSAGFHHAQGEVVITLDADLQNDPADIPLLLAKMDEGVDVVSGWRKHRQDPFWSRRLPSMLANGLISRITGVALHDYGCTLKAYRRDIIKDVHLYGEMHRFIPALASWVGGRVTEVPVQHHPRRFGTSKYGLSRTVRVILDLITVKFLMRYSLGPMQMFGKIGLMFLVPALLLFALMIGTHLSFLFFGTTVGAELVKRPFWLVSATMLSFLGVQFISMGLLAEIQIRTYHESQDKRTYVIRECWPEETKGT